MSRKGAQIAKNVNIKENEIQEALEKLEAMIDSEHHENMRIEGNFNKIYQKGFDVSEVGISSQPRVNLVLGMWFSSGLNFLEARSPLFDGYEAEGGERQRQEG